MRGQSPPDATRDETRLTTQQRGLIEFADFGGLDQQVGAAYPCHERHPWVRKGAPSLPTVRKTDKPACLGLAPGCAQQAPAQLDH